MTYLRAQKKSAPTAISESTKSESATQATQSSQIQDIVVSNQGDNAQVQIKGITGRNYHIQNLESGQGFKIQIPHTQIQQVQKMMENPHPLIQKIEIHEMQDQPDAAELVFYTQKDVHFLDSQMNDTLTIDFAKPQSEGTVADNQNTDKDTSNSDKNSSLANVKPIEPSQAMTTKTTTKPKSTKSATASSQTSSTKIVKKSPKAATKKPTVSPSTGDFDTQVDALTEDEQPSVASKFQEPAQTKAQTELSNNLESFEAPVIQDEDFKNQMKTTPTTPGSRDKSLEIGAFGTSNPSTESIDQPTDHVPMVDPSEPKIADEDDGFNLKGVAEEETPKSKSDINLLDAETELSMKENLGGTGTQVAVAPQNQKFDLNQVKANLPALQNMTVQKSGTGAIVTFDREKSNIQYKFFKMVNPSRIVVEFKDAKNQLKPEYPRFSGTKISRVETREYGSAEGTLVRVIMYVDGAPNYVSTKKGNQLIVELK